MKFLLVTLVAGVLGLQEPTKVQIASTADVTVIPTGPYASEVGPIIYKDEIVGDINGDCLVDLDDLLLLLESLRSDPANYPRQVSRLTGQARVLRKLGENQWEVLPTGDDGVTRYDTGDTIRLIGTGGCP